MRIRTLVITMAALTASAWAGIVDDVRTDLAQNNFSAAERALNSYRSQQGVNPEYLEAYSWLGRAALDKRQYEQAAGYAKQTKTMAVEQLKQRALDAEPHLPIALGAAFEVESQALAARGQRTQAVSVLQAALRTYGTSSIRARLQKNLNLLSLQGKPAPALKAEQSLGAKLPPGASAAGHPISGSQAADSGIAKRIAGTPVLLGALVRRLQGGGSDHHATAIRIRGQRIESHRPDPALRLHGAGGACSAKRRTQLHRRCAPSFLRWAARYAGPDQQIQL
jgi:tetratricopeptide (TPR) repeat protein